MKFTQKTSDSVSLEWGKFQNLDENQFVEYLLKITKKPSNNDAESNSPPIIKSSSTTTYEVTGLESATDYDVQVCIRSVEFGESEYTGGITFETDTNSEKSEVAKLEDYVVCRHVFAKWPECHNLVRYQTKMAHCPPNFLRKSQKSPIFDQKCSHLVTLRSGSTEIQF